jgi:hypothetical protein
MRKASFILLFNVFVLLTLAAVYFIGNEFGLYYSFHPVNKPT